MAFPGRSRSSSKRSGRSPACSTAANNPRNQPLFAEVDDVPVSMSLGAQITAGVKIQNMKAEAWSADPPEGRPAAEAWDMYSRASAEVRGGRARLAFTGCSLSMPQVGTDCQLGGTTQASYTTSSGVDCAAFPTVPGAAPVGNGGSR
jgi:hypothetical protein